jgi:hypothetical protein
MSDPFPHEVDEALWDEACRRAEAVREFLKHRLGKMTAGDVALLATELAISRATAYRLIKLFRAGGTVMSLVDRKRGRPDGHRVLDDQREAIIRTTINRYYLTRNRPTVSQLVRDVQTNCMSVGLKPPHRRTIKARLEEIDPSDYEPGPTLRSQLLGWRITCPLCGGLFRRARGHDRPSPFDRHHGAALVGERLLDDEAERGVRTWTSPAEIARLLLMRRVPRPIPPRYEPWRFRVLGAIIPDLDDVVATERRSLPTPANPILPLHLRPALLAGVAIVERAGPEMLKMLRAKMMGQNQARFSSAIDEIMNQHAVRWRLRSCS